MRHALRCLVRKEAGPCSSTCGKRPPCIFLSDSLNLPFCPHGLTGLLSERGGITHKAVSLPRAMNSIFLVSVKLWGFQQVSTQFLDVSDCALSRCGWKQKSHATSMNVFLVVWRMDACVLHLWCWWRSLLPTGSIAFTSHAGYNPTRALAALRKLYSNRICQNNPLAIFCKEAWGGLNKLNKASSGQIYEWKT